MSRVIRICPGVGDRKCGAFLSSLDRDPHPTCTRCRGKVCTMEMTCDICADWSVAQWEQFVKKRAYKDRKKPSRPSGSVPPAPLASPRRVFSFGSLRPGTSSSSSSHPSGGQGKQGGGHRGHLVLVLERLPPLPLNLGPARGVGVSLDFHLVRAGALSLLLLLLLRERAKRDLPAHSRLPFPTPLPRLSLLIPHRTLDDLRNRERFQSLAPACYPPVVPGLRIEEHGRIGELGHERVAPVDVAVVFALAPLPVRGQEVESDDDGHRPSRSLLVPSHAVTGHSLLTATGRGVEALVHGETGLDPRIDTGPP